MTSRNSRETEAAAEGQPGNDTGGSGSRSARATRFVGAVFATAQIKAIFSVLLQEYEFETARPSESYRNNHSKMVDQLVQPVRVRYRWRK
jgi:hypothetical protein